MLIEPIRVPSLKEACIRRLEELILSGELKPGERLPPERILAQRFSISRPVVHEALVDLASKGLVTISPRHGVRICDFRTQGSVAILSSLLEYHNGKLDPAVLSSLMEMRILVEVEGARQAAACCSSEDIHTLEELFRSETDLQASSTCDADGLTDLDFRFHLQVALASGNLIYPLIINSFKSIYTSLTRAFFNRVCGTPAAAEVLEFQGSLIRAIKEKQADQAGRTMQAMLVHGQKILEQVIPAEAGTDRSLM